jgi:hypothetical protein
MSENHADKAERIRASAARQYETIRAREDLTDEAKAERIAEVYRETKHSVAQAREDAGVYRETRARQLARDLFGHRGMAGADAISARDAADRVAGIDSPSEAQRVLDTAVQNGDTTLAKAVGRIAFDRAQGGEVFGQGWSTVLNNFASSQSKYVAEKLDELQTLSQPASMEEGFNYVLSAPPEAHGRVGIFD